MYFYIHAVVTACALGTAQGFGVVGGSRGAAGVVSRASWTAGRESNKIFVTSSLRHNRCFHVLVREPEMYGASTKEISVLKESGATCIDMHVLLCGEGTKDDLPHHDGIPDSVVTVN